MTDTIRIEAASPGALRSFIHNHMTRYTIVSLVQEDRGGADSWAEVEVERSRNGGDFQIATVQEEG